jgi:nucleoid-associated protein YgaU
MRKLQLLILLAIFVMPMFLFGQFVYLSDEDYKKLSSSERTQYLADLNAEMLRLGSQTSTSNAEAESLDAEIEELRKKIAEVDSGIQTEYDRLGISDQTIADIHTRIQYYKDQLSNWERMSDDELWRNATAFKELEEDYLGTRNRQLARLPEFQRDFNDLDRRFQAINDSIQRARRGYYHVIQPGDTADSIARIFGNESLRAAIARQMRNNTTVEFNAEGKVEKWKVYRGESLWRISQYYEVYGSGRHWPAIYRANQDKIKNPDLIFPNQDFVIPQPLPSGSTVIPAGYTPSRVSE